MIIDGVYLLSVNIDAPEGEPRARFIGHHEKAILDNNNKNFVTLTHEELELAVGHKVALDPARKGHPVLSERDTEIVGAAAAIKHVVQSNPNLSDKEKRRIVDQLRGMAKGAIRQTIEGGMKYHKVRQDRLALQRSMLDEVSWWIRRPLVLEKPDGSALHKFQQAIRDEAVVVILRVGWDENPAVPAEMVDTTSGLQSFVVEHDWSGVLSHAEISGEGSGEIAMPFTATCFEFRVSGRRVLAIINEDPDRIAPTRMATVAAMPNDQWAVLMTYDIDPGWTARPIIDEGYHRDAIKDMQPLADLICRNVRAIGIMLESQIVEREVVRIDAKLNRAREKRGKLPLSDYHVVSLARRERAKPRPLDALDPNRDIVHRRWHLVRSHWRQYQNHRTRIPWHSRGDIDLGIVDKHYKL